MWHYIVIGGDGAANRVDAVGVYSSMAEAEKAAISYALDNKREILILDSAKFGQLQPNNFAPEIKQAKFSLPYFTMVLNGKKEFEPKMVHFLFDSTYKVIETKIYDVNADSTES